MSEQKRTCNYCMKEMSHVYRDMCKCENPKCISYALVQIPVEQMPKEKRKQ